MALIHAEGKACITVELTTADDGEGGQTVSYVDGTAFKAVLAPANSAQDKAILADKDISKGTVRVFYEPHVELKLNDIFRTVLDNQFYKVITSGFMSANTASIKRGLAYAEKWEVPEDEYSE